MTHSLKCPSCHQLLYFPELGTSAEDFQESLCTKCKHKYALLHTRVLNFVSTVEAKSSRKYDKHPSYQRDYKLRLDQASGAIRAVEFTTPGEYKRISALPDDEMLLLYTMKGQALHDLIWLQNLITSKRLLLLHPNSKARSKGLVAGVLTFVASSIAAGFMHIPTNKLFFAAAVPGAVGVGAYVTKRTSLKVRDHNELQRLASQQQLLAQKYTLEQKITNLMAEKELDRRLIARLEALQQKMVSAGEVYEKKVATVARAIKIVQEQIGMTENLVVGYSQLIQSLEIEYDAAQITEQLPGDASDQILNKWEALLQIEAKKEELALQENPQKLLSDV